MSEQSLRERVMPSADALRATELTEAFQEVERKQVELRKATARLRQLIERCAVEQG